GLAVQATYLLLRRGYSEDGWVGRLASLAVGACRLAERCRIGEDVEQIVLDLEREPDRSREPGKRLLEPRLEPVHAGRAHHDAHPDQCTGLQGMHLFDLADTERAPLGLEVDRLATGHTEAADGAREQLHQAHADDRIGRERRITGE